MFAIIKKKKKSFGINGKLAQVVAIARGPG